MIFKHPPRPAFLKGAAPYGPQPAGAPYRPGSGLRLVMLSKGPQGRASRTCTCDLAFAAELGKPPESYERLLHDALAGEDSLFTREDAVEVH